MQRYNPPQTSQQMYCQGCNRQIRKVQEMMDEQYMTRMNHQIEMNNMNIELQKTERQLELERFKNKTIMTLMAKEPVEKDEKAKKLTEINEKLVEELNKKLNVPTTFPLEEWREAIEQKWSEKFERLRDYALDRNDMVKYYEEQNDLLRGQVDKLRKEIKNVKRSLLEREEELYMFEKKKESDEFARKIEIHSPKSSLLDRAMSVAIEMEKEDKKNSPKSEEVKEETIDILEMFAKLPENAENNHSSNDN